MAEVLANIFRNNLVESIHTGDIAVVDKNGALLAGVGNEKKVTYWRSAAKPFQALPVIYSGAARKFGLTDRELAIMAASHSGEKKHTDIVKSILDKIGLAENYLQCGVHSPLDRDTAHSLREKGERPSSVHCNCSGKHAGLLALCQHFNWSIDDYLSPGHRLQKLLLNIVSEITGYPENGIYRGEDGCGVVVFGLPLKNMAYAYARLANPEKMPSRYREAAEKVCQVMKENPDIIAGSGRFNTKLMDVLGDKLVAKSGAEGVFCIGIFGGAGLAVKIADGNKRAIPPVVVELLHNLDILSKEELNRLEKQHICPVTNHHNHKVGRIVPDYILKFYNSPDQEGEGGI